MGRCSMASGQRRLPNGRFAKFVQLPDSKKGRRRGPEGLGGQIIIQTNVGIAKDALKDLRQRVPAAMLADSQQRAARVQERLRTAVEVTYTKGTGRVSRGIFAKVSKSTVEGKEEVALRITMRNYREVHFMTNLGGNGYFKSHPVKPYRIFAKGAQEIFERINSATGEVSYYNPKTGRLRSKVKHRLKVPRDTSFLDTVVGPGGAESRVIRDILGPPDPGDALGAFYFYPLWVKHPGFPDDVISLVARDEGAAYITETEELIRFAHIKVGKEGDKFFSFEKGREKISNLAVADVIPLPKVTLTRSELRVETDGAPYNFVPGPHYGEIGSRGRQIPRPSVFLKFD